MLRTFEFLTIWIEYFYNQNFLLLCALMLYQLYEKTCFAFRMKAIALFDWSQFKNHFEEKFWGITIWDTGFSSFTVFHVLAHVFSPFLHGPGQIGLRSLSPFWIVHIFIFLMPYKHLYLLFHFIFFCVLALDLDFVSDRLNIVVFHHLSIGHIFIFLAKCNNQCASHLHVSKADALAHNHLQGCKKFLWKCPISS